MLGYKFRICNADNTFVYIGATVLVTCNVLSVISIIWLHHLSKYLNLHTVFTFWPDCFPCKPIAHHTMVMELIREGNDKKPEEVLEKTPEAGAKQDYEGNSPINFAIREGKVKCVEILMKASISGTDVYGTEKTPATTACVFGQIECLEILMREGIDVRAEDGTEKTPATTACAFGQSQFLEILMREDIDVTAEDGTG